MPTKIDCAYTKPKSPPNELGEPKEELKVFTFIRYNIWMSADKLNATTL